MGKLLTQISLLSQRLMNKMLDQTFLIFRCNINCNINYKLL